MGAAARSPSRMLCSGILITFALNTYTRVRCSCCPTQSPVNLEEKTDFFPCSEVNEQMYAPFQLKSGGKLWPPEAHVPMSVKNLILICICRNARTCSGLLRETTVRETGNCWQMGNSLVSGALNQCDFGPCRRKKLQIKLHLMLIAVQRFIFSSNENTCSMQKGRNELIWCAWSLLIITWQSAIRLLQRARTLQVCARQSTQIKRFTVRHVCVCIVRRCKSPTEEISDEKQSCCSLQYCWNYLFICRYSARERESTEKNVVLRENVFTCDRIDCSSSLLEHGEIRCAMQMTVGAARWRNGSMNNIYRLSFSMAHAER